MVNDGDLKKLLQLKKLETPGREYFDHFVPEFHRYQRSEILHPSFSQRIAEKVSEIFAMVFRPAPVLGMATAAVIAVVVAVSLQSGSQTRPSEFAMTYQNTAKGIVKGGFINATATYSDPLIQEPELQHNTPATGSHGYRNDEKGHAPYVNQVALQYDSNLTF